MSARIVAGVAIALLLGMGAGWFLMNFERVEERRYVGMSGEARTNPLLAFERMVKAMGRPARNAKGLPSPGALATDGVLVLGRFRQALSGVAIGQIVEWVDRGGFLVVEAEKETLEDDALLDALGVSREADGRKDLLEAIKEREVALPWSKRSFRAVLPQAQTLTVDGDTVFEFADPRGVRIAGFERGAGRVVVYSDFAPISNAGIGRAENASLAWALLAWSESNGEVVFVTRPGRLSVWRWLVEQVPYALFACGLLVALWLWRIAIRFGPVAPDPLPARRRLTDHLAATGRFLWRERQTEPLARAARDAALAAMARLVPGFAAANRPDQARMIVSRFGCTPEEARALLAATADGTDTFTSTVRLAQRIRATGASNNDTRTRIA